MISEDDKNMMSEVLMRIMIETHIYRRLRLSHILARVAKKQDIDSAEKYVKKFKERLSDLELTRRINKRDVIVTSPENSIGYFGKMACDDEFMYDEEIEQEIITINAEIDEFSSALMPHLMDGSLFG